MNVLWAVLTFQPIVRIIFERVETCGGVVLAWAYRCTICTSTSSALVPSSARTSTSALVPTLILVRFSSVMHRFWLVFSQKFKHTLKIEIRVIQRKLISQ